MKARNSPSAVERKESNTLVTVSEVAEQVGREILESRLEPGAWATALYESDGNHQDAVTVYTRLRVRQLSRQRRVRLAKVSSLESRRIAFCMGDQATRDIIARTIQEMLGNPARGRSVNFAKPRLSLVWLTILFFGTAGTVASFGRLFSHVLPDSLSHPLTLVALLAGVGSVWGAIILRFYLPKRWIMLGWNTGLVITCNLLCLSSLYLGTKVIKRAVAAGTAPVEIQQAAAPVLVRGKMVKTTDAKESNVALASSVSPQPEIK